MKYSEAANFLEIASKYIFSKKNLNLPSFKKAADCGAAVLKEVSKRRLVDKDKLLEAFQWYVKKRGNVVYSVMGLKDVMDIIEDAPESFEEDKNG